ncbi:motility associated factor glycosyltransferase family protein [Haliovirga abyssi]|uniref:6-hydroxymethylpterin diphosphokinase MptE-like domain-containing protein n=1 Tax=Haliovirga abyssi TaxID=2996794 RepID=A0AAU9DDM7_9FUSO|nr:6-hydroxymethylpterin diphosphokinase MptE-like protein [Haliovirga abyssi]BDU50273.1 hypothetical protein HLVA_08420 [Haliovirga abyssi]
MKNLQGKNIKLYKMLKELDNSCEEVEVISTKNGEYTAKLNGKFLHSKYNPYKEAEKVISNYSIKEKKVVTLFGIGFGYYLEEILKHIKSDTKIFIIEENLCLLKKLFEIRNFDKMLLNENIFIYHTSQKFEFIYKLEENLKVGFALDYEVIVHKVESEFYSKEYNEFISEMKNSLSNNLVNTATIFEFSKMWQKNRFMNLKNFAKSIPAISLFNELKNMPAVIVAAGPSLDKNIMYLKWIKNKALIIAVGTVLKKLLAEGIEPDIIVSVDGGEPNWEHFSRIDYEEIPLAYEPMLNPKISSKHKGIKVGFVTQDVVSAWAEKILGEMGFVKSGGTVAISSYDFAIKLGCNPIILLGQDLAYSGGKSHVSSTVYENDEVKEESEDIHQMEVLDIFNEKILTDRKFFTFKQYFERFIAGDKAGNNMLKIIDATEGGAKISGTEIMTLKDVYFKYIADKNIDFRKILESKIDTIDFNERLKKIEDGKKDLKSKLIKFLKIVEKGIKVINKLQKNPNKVFSDKLDKIDIELKKELEVSFFITYITQPIISTVIKEKVNNKDLNDILKSNLKLYKGIKEAVEYTLECLGEE